MTPAMKIDAPAPLNDTINVERLAAYLHSAVPSLSGDIDVSQFTAGHSNLTYMVRFGDQELVVKRAPPGAKAKSAHDMGREFTMMSNLHGHYQYAPRAYAYCEDESIVGSAFCVMERVTGIIVRRTYDADTPPATIPAQFIGLLNGLADLHNVDIGAAGLGGFGRPSGYTERQVRGWMKRLTDARTDDMADFSDIISWLDNHVPAQSGRFSVIHNDFKMDNLVWDASDETKLKAVLDWEMATVGDPLMDLACTLSFWVEPTDPPALLALRAMPTLYAGVPTRREAIAHYATRTGLAVESFAFYQCFGLFRRAVIEQQKYVRFRSGATADPRFANLNQAVTVLRDMCWAAMKA